MEKYIYTVTIAWINGTALYFPLFSYFYVAAYTYNPDTITEV